MAGVLRAMRAAPELGSCMRDQVIEAKRSSARTIVARAVARGELPPAADPGPLHVAPARLLPAALLRPAARRAIPRARGRRRAHPAPQSTSLRRPTTCPSRSERFLVTDDITARTSSPDEEVVGSRTSGDTRSTALDRARRHRCRSVDGDPRCVHREHRAAVRAGRTRHHRRRPPVGADRRTSRSAGCCCWAAGSPTTWAVSGRSSSGSWDSRAPPPSAVSRPTRDCCSLPGPAGRIRRLLAPASLAILTVTFTEPKERARAFGVFGAIAGGGAAIGLVLGGILTEYFSWRWCLGVNVPIAVVVAVAAFPS